MNKSEPLISVIIPIYNMELYLPRCLDSVLNNTYRNLEVICIDDGSKDRSLEILRRYEAADPRIVVIEKENGGVSSARNAGLERMKGEYVTFVDPDDYIHPQYFEILLAVKSVSGADICIGDFIKTTNVNALSDFPSFSVDLQSIKLYSYSQVGHVPQICTYICSKLIPRIIVGKTRFPEDISYGEDTLFLCSLWESNPSLRFGLIHFPIYYYYQGRPDSLVQSGRDDNVVCFVSALANRASSPKCEKLYLELAIKRSLYFRYYYTFIQNEGLLSRQLGRVIRPKIRQLLRSNYFSVKNKVFWTLFILSPRIDRLHRIYREPSLLKFEQFQKAALAKNQEVNSCMLGEQNDDGH